MSAEQDGWAHARDRATWENQAARGAVAIERERIAARIDEMFAGASSGLFEPSFAARLKADLLVTGTG